tara:strand:- start:8551 stop:9321 length:771 start_codon:yes stop_codon:yes gene_type:complete
LKHIALRSKSVRSGDRPYTTPGLGDRVHSAMIAYQYGKAHNSPVTIHITDDKWSIAGGKPSGKKKKSWIEILSLFPSDTLYLEPHPVENLSEVDWIKYLKSEGYDAYIYHYADTIHMHPNETRVGIEMSQYIKESPKLKPIVDNGWLPDEFITVQWDSTDSQRTIPEAMRKEIHDKYGCPALYVGGEGKGLLKSSIPHIGLAMANAKFHVGSDSGMMHVAQLYMNYEDIHIYDSPGSYRSHHLVRAISNGSKYFKV